ncbi:MAG TPA: LysR family transcriptional regulator [Polyangiaceae bacterium]|nr:LysR family transcriptional regulator [Polyangiaceae bacterium]
MKLDQLDGVLAFVTVAQKRSFSAAAAELEVTPPAISQAIKQLEDRLGVRLFNRTTRSVSLTEAGACFHAKVAPALQQIGEAAQGLDDFRSAPSGLLRLNSSHVAWEMLLREAVRSFLEQQPDIRIEVHLEDAFVDIVEGGYDAGLRLGDSVQRDMVSTLLTRHERFALVASPDYISRRGAPAQLNELRDHACIRFRFRGAGGIYRWELIDRGELLEIEVQGPLTVSDSRSLREAALDGVGIAHTFLRLVEPDLAQGRLVAILPEHWPTFAGFSLYYPHRAQQPAKLRAFIDHCRTLTAPHR